MRFIPRTIMTPKISLGVALLTAFAAGFLVSCGSGEEAKSEPNANNQSKTTNVEVVPLVRSEMTDFIHLTGVVKPFTSVTVSAEESGVLNRVFFVEGSYIRKGDTLATIENSYLKASLEEAEAAYLLAELTARKQENLYKENSVSELTYLNAKYSADIAKARFDQLETRFQKTFVVSPVSGVAVKKHRESGEFIAASTPLAGILNFGTVKIEVGVPERYVNIVKPGTEVQIKFDFISKKEFHAKVSVVVPEINKDNRTFPVEVYLNNTTGLLKPEMIANLKIRGKVYKDALVIPRDAMVETETGSIVFVEEQGQAKLRTGLTVAASYGGDVVISEGLSDGDRLIVLGHRELIDGESVRVVKVREP